jgi:predicted regulator of amino acid metabolism with ACT domain
MDIKKPSLMPVSFKEFNKDPIKALLFITLLTIGYLYIDSKMMYTNQIEIQTAKIEKLEIKIDALTAQLRKSDSTLAAATAKMGLLQQLGKIQ